MIHIQKFTFNPFGENTYVVYNDEKQAYIVDPGNIQDFETAEIESFISENELKIESILLTHAHIDHVLGLQWAHDTYKVPVLLHEVEQEILDRNPFTAKQYGFFMKPFDGDKKYIQEGETLNLGNDEFEILNVPGHSPGHVAFHNKDQKLVLSGDVLFEGSIGRTDLYKGDHGQLLDSIRTKLFALDSETKVYSGHGNPTTIGFEKVHNPFFK